MSRFRSIMAQDEADGDWVGVVTAWKMPGALEGVTASDLLRVQRHIADGKWRENSRASAWAGKAVAEALKLDIREAAVKKRVMAMIKACLSGCLTLVG